MNKDVQHNKSFCATTCKNKHTNLLNFMNFNLKMRITLNSKCEANFGQISFVTTVTQFEQAACFVVPFDAYASMHASFFCVSVNNTAKMS